MEDSSKAPQKGAFALEAQLKPDEHLDGKYPSVMRKEQRYPQDQNVITKYSSPQGSVNSMDAILREQSELDQSIAALRDMSSQGLRASPDEIRNPFALDSNTETIPNIAGRSRSTFNSTKTESLSNRSDFSLSVFPEPPMVPEPETSTRHLQEDGLRSSIITSKRLLAPVEIATPTLPSPAQTTPPPLQTGATQYDVTSFIGGKFLFRSG